MDSASDHKPWRNRKKQVRVSSPTSAPMQLPSALYAHSSFTTTFPSSVFASTSNSMSVSTSTTPTYPSLDDKKKPDPHPNDDPQE
jgi:hypothetical protein